MSLSIVLTCYDEVPKIFRSYERIVRLMDLTKIDYEVVVVDDGSQEPARAELAGYFRDRPGVRLVLSDRNEGRGAAVSKGIAASRKDYVASIDTDLQIPEHHLFALYDAALKERADMILGHRHYVLGMKPYHWLRYVCSRAYRRFADLILGLGGLDTETGIKMYRREAFLPVLESVEDKRWFWDTESVAEGLRRGLSVLQVPVFVIRRGDASTVRVFRDTYRYVSSLYRYRKRRNRHG